MLIVHSPGNASIGAWLKTQAGEGYDFAAYGADVADHASCQELAGLIQADGHHIDILVNNAGITRDATFRKLSYADWDAVLRVNLDSVFNVTRPFIDGMLERGWGRIVNISSINGSKGQFGQTNYSAAKAGMHGFTKALAQEVARKGVTVNTVSPGYLDTKMVTSMSEEFEDASFDVVLQIDTLQHLRNAEVMLRETVRVGRVGIVAFPNFVPGNGPPDPDGSHRTAQQVPRSTAPDWFWDAGLKGHVFPQRDAGCTWKTFLARSIPITAIGFILVSLVG